MQPSTIEELQGHYREILRLLGEDPQREGLLKTPLRVAKAMQDLTRGYATDPIAILNSAKHNGESHSASDDSKTYKPGSRKRYKTSGYRIRIFTGGNSKKDKEQAQKVGEKCRKQFPELSVYTHFVSPRWVCTVGDFTTMEDAKKYITPIRSARISYEVRVVKSEVFLVE